MFTPAVRSVALALTTIAAAASVAAAPAHARPGGGQRLALAFVQASALAEPGGPLQVRLVVRAPRPARQAGGIAVYLSTDARRSKDDVRLLTSSRAPRSVAKGRTAVATSVRVPRAQPLGAYRVIVCLGEAAKASSKTPGRDCRAAASGISVVGKVGASETPRALIAADVAAGRITGGQALAFRVFAVFGDERLPTKYVGGATVVDDDTVMRELASAWGGLSPAVRRQVGRYFLPSPLREATAAELKAGGAKRRARGRNGTRGKKAIRLQDQDTTPEEEENEEPEVDPGVCDTEYFRPRSWQKLDAAGGKIHVWWRTDRPEDGKDASTMGAALTLAYGRYKALLGRDLPSDGAVDCYHGPDGGLDVYIDRVARNSAITVPAVQMSGKKANCEGYPGFIVTNPTSGSNSLSMPFVMAHELFHVFQMSYAYQAGCEEYAWFDEGSANWAAHTVYPTDDSEHLWDAQLLAPRADVASDYYSWIFVLWMERTLGADAIRKTFEAFADQPDAVHAVDASIGTWRSTFLDFAKHAWNQDPFASYAAWDRLPTTPRDVEDTYLALNGQKQRTDDAAFEMSARARDYRRYHLTDDAVRKVTFRNDLAAEPDARIGAILTLRSGATRWEDWSGRESVELCRDEPDQDVVDFVLVYANSKLGPRGDSGTHIKGRPQLDLRDSCDDLPWRFTILSASLKTHLDGKRPVGGTTICPTMGFATRDEVDFTATAGAAAADPSTKLNMIVKRPFGEGLDGRFEAKAPGATWVHALTGCDHVYKKPGPLACSTSKSETATGDWPLGFSLEAASRTASTASLTWYVPAPITGYFDGDDTVCNVMGLSGPVVEPSTQRSTVPMSMLQGTAPFTVVLSGGVRWGAGDLGESASMSYDWDYTMTLQRQVP